MPSETWTKTLYSNKTKLLLRPSPGLVWARKLETRRSFFGGSKSPQTSPNFIEWPSILNPNVPSPIVLKPKTQVGSLGSPRENRLNLRLSNVPRPQNFTLE